MDTVRVAIVGCGRISDLHALGYRNRQDARITAVCDIKGSNARTQAKAWGVEKVYDDFDDVLNDKAVDLVELLTPHHLHYPMTVAACQAGKHVSVQKPMCLTSAEADEMIQAANQAGVVLRVYENMINYAPVVKAKELIDAGEIGTPRMLRMHVSTGSDKYGWNVPLNAWFWRYDPKLCGGGPLVFDHGYHMFSLAYDLMGEVENVYAWIDLMGLAPGANMDAPAVIMMKFKAMNRYGVFDVSYTPETVIHSDYYCDDDRVEIVGDKGILFINRYTTRTVDLPELMLFKDGKTTPIHVEGVDWSDSFITTTHQLIDVLRFGGNPRLDGQTGKAVLQIALAAQLSARSGREVAPEEVP